MKNILGTLILGFIVSGCNESISTEDVNQEKDIFNLELAEELKMMAEVDQIAAYIPQGEYKKMTSDEWKSFKDSVFTAHQRRLQEIFDRYGFVGFDLAGKEGSESFWLMVQHSDHTPDFQKKVLEEMKIEVEEGNADPGSYGLLVDRVKLNTGEDQVYGSQVSYNLENCQAYADSLEDSINVNERRKSVGLEPIEEYLNRMSISHFEMNKEFYLKRGITEPKLYDEEK